MNEVYCCNKCGMSCQGHVGNWNGLINCEVAGAYDSSHFDDGAVFIFSLCEKCLVDLFATFKLSAYVGNFLNPDDKDILDMKKYHGGVDWPSESKSELVELIKSWKDDDKFKEYSTESLTDLLYRQDNNLSDYKFEEKTLSQMRQEVNSRIEKTRRSGIKKQ